MFSEPGFYEVGKTGVRLENVYQIVEKHYLQVLTTFFTELINIRL